MYFELQMVASLLLALTYPGGGIGGGTGALFRGAASARGVLETEDRWAVLLPLGTMLVLSTANEMVVVPKTISLMWKLHVGTFFDKMGSVMSHGRWLLILIAIRNRP